MQYIWLNILPYLIDRFELTQKFFGLNLKNKADKLGLSQK